jgi:AcrR family transcriptional regulator
MNSQAASFQRARRPEQKLQRQLAIIGAARELALRDGVVNVSLTDIAEGVGLHKSALLRYFETREQVFLVLAAELWLEWAGAMHAALDGAASGASEVVIDVTVRSLARRPLFCDLIAHAALDLERKVSPDGVRRYQQVSLGVIDDVVGVVHRALPALSVGECREYVSTLVISAGALWQMANPSPSFAELCASDQELSSARVDLPMRLRRLATILLAGLVPSRAPGPAPAPPWSS